MSRPLQFDHGPVDVVVHGFLLFFIQTAVAGWRHDNNAQSDENAARMENDSVLTNGFAMPMRAASSSSAARRSATIVRAMYMNAVSMFKLLRADVSM